MFALVVETVVFIAFLTGGTYLCGGVTGVAAILHVVAFQTTSKAASLVVKRPGDQIRRETFQARRAIRAVLAPSRALLTLRVGIPVESVATGSCVTSRCVAGAVNEFISCVAACAVVFRRAIHTVSNNATHTCSILPKRPLFAFISGWINSTLLTGSRILTFQAAFLTICTSFCILIPVSSVSTVIIHTNIVLNMPAIHAGITS